MNKQDEIDYAKKAIDVWRSRLLDVNTSSTQKKTCKNQIAMIKRHLNALVSRQAYSPNQLQPGVPCGHPGCLNHATHACEGCGRIAGR